jgi:hypothetical protein
MTLDCSQLAPALQREIHSILHWYPQAAEAIEKGGNFEYRPHVCTETHKICLHDEHENRYYELDVMRGIEVRNGQLFDVRWNVGDEHGWMPDSCEVTSGRYPEFLRGYTKDSLAKTYVGYYTEVMETADDYLDLFHVGARPVDTLNDRIKAAAQAAMDELYPPCPFNNKSAAVDTDGQLALF